MAKDFYFVAELTKCCQIMSHCFPGSLRQDRGAERAHRDPPRHDGKVR